MKDKVNSFGENVVLPCLVIGIIGLALGLGCAIGLAVVDLIDYVIRHYVG